MARGFTITQGGKKLLAELVITGELKITRVMVGKGEVQQGQQPEQFTDLIEPVAQATATIPVVKNGVISFIVEYRNDLNGGLQEGFWLKEFGVFAQDGGKEILLYYASLGEYPQYIEAYENGKVNIKKYPVSLVVADDVKVTIAYAALAFVTEERMKEFVEIEALPYLEGVLAESENNILTELEKKADKEIVEQALNTKADTTIIQQALDQKADAQAVQTALDKKADKESLAEELAKKANAETVIEKLAKKADAETMQQALDQKANEMEMLTELGKKADKENVIQELAGKADKEDVKTELDKKADKEEIEEILQQIDGANIVLELDKKADKETVIQELTKKADAAHEHSADEITDGILPIERGDTGATTAADARTNLGAAASSHSHNYADSSSAGGSATSAVKLQTARTIDGMNFDGSANITHFCVCNTAIDVAEKTVSLPGFVLAEGVRLVVFFYHGNTATSPTLNVNDTGPKPIYRIIEGGNMFGSIYPWGYSGIALEFIYYKNAWITILSNDAPLKDSGVRAGTYGPLELVKKIMERCG